MQSWTKLKNRAEKSRAYRTKSTRIYQIYGHKNKSHIQTKLSLARIDQNVYVLLNHNVVHKLYSLQRALLTQQLGTHEYSIISRAHGSQ